MKTFNYLLAIILLSILTPGFSQNNFVNCAAYGGNQNDGSRAIAVEPNGDYYVTGHFTGVVMFGATMLNSAGNKDIFIAKFSTGGIVQWAVRAGGANNDEGLGIALGNGDSLYVTGYYTGLTSGNFAIAGIGGTDIFLHKLSKSTGAGLGVLRAGSLNNDEGRGLAFDPKNNNVYVTGLYRNNAVFAGAPIASVGGSDIFTAASFGGMGTWNWVNVMGSAANDEGHSIATNDFGHIFCTGYFSGAIGALPYVGGRDIYVTRHDQTTGALVAIVSGGAVGNDEGNGITCTPKGKYIYITGYHTNNATIGLSVHAAVGTDILVAQLDTVLVWGTSTSTGAAGNEHGNSIFYDRYCNVLNTGGVAANGITFGFGAMAYANRGIYVAEANAATLAWNWVMRGDGTNYDECWGVVSNGSSNVMCCGTFSSAPLTLFNTTMANVVLANAGNTEIWVGEVQKPVGCVGGGTAMMEKSTPQPENNLNAWKGFPNPASDFITMQAELTEKGIVNYEVYDVQGKRVFQSSVALEEGTREIVMDLNTVKPGIYFFRAELNGNISQIRFVKQ